jgi:hypothetical protein
MALNAGVMYPNKSPVLNAGLKYLAKPQPVTQLNAGIKYPNQPQKPVLNAGLAPGSTGSGITAINGRPTQQPAKPNTNWQTTGNGAGGVPGHVGRPNDPFSLQNTGQYEDAFQQNQDRFWGKDTAANSVWNTAQGAYAGRAPQTSYATDAYNKFNASNPNANLDPYYDRAREQTGEALNRQAAATGQLGSTMANDQFGGAMAALAAEQANREGQYNLDWNRQNFGMASGADQGGLARDQGERSWLAGLAGAGFGADNADLSRVSGGLAAAGSAQGAREGRINNMLNALLGYTGGINTELGGNYMDWRDQDAGNFDSIEQLLLGQVIDRRNAGIRVGEDWNKDTEHVTNVGTSWAGAFGGGGMGG